MLKKNSSIETLTIFSLIRPIKFSQAGLTCSIIPFSLTITIPSAQYVITPVSFAFDCFKSYLPETVTVPKQNGFYVPYSPVTAIPNCVAAQYGFGPYAGFGFNNSGSLWG